ncbi:MAG: trypsin-like serine protease [Chloroflexota bacterium]
MVRRFKLALAMSMVAAVLFSASAMAITKNYRVDNDHPFVGLVVFYDEDGDFSHRCSGSLLSSTVFLTAGHCTDDGAGGVMPTARIWFNQSGGKEYDPATQLDAQSGYPEFCGPVAPLGTLCATSHEMYNYGFDNFAGFPNTKDAGIIILDQPIDPGEYGSLADVGTLDALLKARGTKDVWFRLSGYGLSYSSPVAFVSFRERLQADAKLTNLRSANTAGFNLQTTGNGKDMGGSCSGDSGGPVFYPATSNTIVAVTSFGLNAYCRGTDFAYRVDTAAVHDWIADVAD